MVYQALYRKYRSQRFDGMIGQEVVTTTLKNAIVNGQISHAYLFSGPRGTGKTSAAKIFAKAINCPNQKDGEPCNVCDICTAITKGNLEDVIELDAASNNGVDEIREIRDKSTYAASIAKYKVYIIDEVHMLSTGAFNALLKTLEEPTENVVFVLATTELQKIPATIISRVQRFAFKSITTADIRAHLAEVLNEESVEFDEKALDVIAKSAEGGMRDALSLLDQALSFSDGKLEEKAALLVTGSIADEALLAYVTALAASDSTAALTELDKIFAEGKNMLRFVEDLLGHFRDLLFDKGNQIPHERLYGWVDIAVESLKILKETSQTKIAADVMTMRLAEDAVVVKPVEKIVEKVIERQPVTANQPQFESEIPLPEPPGEPVRQTYKKTAPVAAAQPQYSLNRQQILDTLDEAVNEPEAIKQVRAAWEEVIASLSGPRDVALLKISKLAASSSQHLLLTVEHENLVKLITANMGLLDSIGNTLSAICGFAPQVIALTEADWQEIRADYAANRKGSSPKADPIAEEAEAPQSANPIQLAQELFGDKLLVIKD